ncbi:MAG TPA: molybdopterin cofactor-binding domain-containing protein, partial [Solirubrobacteraceae bacterium]|nr:molybdopterin cofactor-binding domain-containing protein [Solirubrobacteraceae bacterium]
MSATIGVPRRRVDGGDKVRGATRYAADLPIPGVLHARLVLATEAHARIAGIDTEAARAVAGVVAVLTAADLPVSPDAPGRAGEPLAREEVVFAGQPVALVVAESEAAAADGVDAVIVDLEPLDAVVDLEAAMAPGAPRARVIENDRGGHDVGGAHAAVSGGDDDAPEEELSENVDGRQRLANGDVAAALAGADATVAGRLRTPWVYQAYLEPQAATAWLDFDGTLVVNSATQGAFATRKGLAELLDLPLDRVRVRPTPLGGAFGGKLMLPEPLAAAAALALKRPVRVAFTR